MISPVSGCLFGTVEAAHEGEAVQKAAEEFKEPATKLYAVWPL
jgi:hypothetical protein